MNAFTALRHAMADPERGAWLSATAHISRSGEADFSYDWMSKPDWGADLGPDDALYLEELRKYPRAPEFIPYWYPS